MEPLAVSAGRTVDLRTARDMADRGGMRRAGTAGILAWQRENRKKAGDWRLQEACFCCGSCFLPGRRRSFSITAPGCGTGGPVWFCRQGEACFLVDGGSSSENRVGQYRILPYLKQQGISRIEGIFITHPDQDHINGILELLKAVGERQVQLSINCLLLPEWMRGKESEGELARAAGKAGIPIRYLKAGGPCPFRGMRHGNSLAGSGSGTGGGRRKQRFPGC